MQMDPAAQKRLSILANAHPDRWIALSADETRVVAEAATFEDAVTEAERSGEADPVLVRVPPDWTPRIL